MKCHRDEANDDVKSNILVAIGNWLKLTTTLPPSVSTTLADCLKEKDALKSAALKATLQVIFLTPPDLLQCKPKCFATQSASASHFSVLLCATPGL